MTTNANNGDFNAAAPRTYESRKGDQGVRLGVISDTHAHLHFTLQAVRVFESLEIDELIHCGDIGSVEAAELLFRWPGHYVFGNVDGDGAELREAIEAAGQTCHGRFGTLERLGRKLAFLHGDDQRRLEETAASGQFDVVCHGHTHRARQEQQGPTLVLNPGAVFRANPRSVAVLDLPSLTSTIIPL